MYFKNAFAKTESGQVVQNAIGTGKKSLTSRWKVAEAMNSDAANILNSGFKEVPATPAAGMKKSNALQRDLIASFMQERANARPGEA